LQHFKTFMFHMEVQRDFYEAAGQKKTVADTSLLFLIVKEFSKSVNGRLNYCKNSKNRSWNDVPNK